MVHGVRLERGWWVCNLHAQAHSEARAQADVARAAATAIAWSRGAPDRARRRPQHARSGGAGLRARRRPQRRPRPRATAARRRARGVRWSAVGSRTTRRCWRTLPRKDRREEDVVIDMRRILLLLCAVVALAAAGCGSSNDSSSSSSASSASTPAASSSSSSSSGGRGDQDAEHRLRPQGRHRQGRSEGDVDQRRLGRPQRHRAIGRDLKSQNFGKGATFSFTPDEGGHDQVRVHDPPGDGRRR